ncbi:hypothetical protein CCAX7_28760 [Capsulimonas corticalis]|uniref:Uncharacterized protein n=1 Tax=Capsulimonas corticalis TaxID=2219043 RepID=A0A402CT86_9BACT|nr:hypothetical protein [Capsulimonas corticalis]BDI30825.1 hypothetical protein CCAX7_28760 [Capsulimonas corticalis]
MIYHINEFSVDSEFDLPCEMAGASSRLNAKSDMIALRRASLAHISCTMRKIRPQLIYDVGDGLLLEPNTTRGMLALHIDFKGRAMTVDCADDLLEIASAWAIHAGLGVATLTHGGIPLHGAGIQMVGRSIALMADSGAGKSTLSWFLLRHGARFANDDLIPVRMMGEEAIAFPSVSLYPKLSREAVDLHGMEIENLIPADYGVGEEEYYVPLPSAQRVAEPSPLAAIFLIRPQPLPKESLLKPKHMRTLVTSRRLSDEEATRTLRRNLHAAWLMERWMDGGKLNGLCHDLAARVPIYELSYPRFFAILPTLAQCVAQLIES